MTHTLLIRAVLALAAVATLLAGCGTTPVADSDVHRLTPDALFVQAHETYRAGDHFLAAEQLIVLARQGDARGRYALGYLYYHGQGVLGDRARALELFRQAAAQGNAKAIKALSLLEGRDPAPAVPKTSTANPAPESEPLETVMAQPSEMPSAAVTAPLTIEPATGETPEGRDRQGMETAIPADVPAQTTAPSELAAPFSAPWLRRQDGSQFTIQLVGGTSRQRLEEFAQRHQLAERGGVVETRLDGQRWYVVLFGLYADFAQARDALGALPTELRSQRPWIRPLRDVVARLAAS